MAVSNRGSYEGSVSMTTTNEIAAVSFITLRFLCDSSLKW